MEIYVFILVQLGLLLTMIQSSIAISCHNNKGKPFPCPKCPNTNCKGNIGKDYCNCCDVCLKQEDEICGGDDDQLGRCDHHVSICAKVSQDKHATCMSYKKAIQLGIKTGLHRKCKSFSPEYIEKKNNMKDFFNCYIGLKGPSYYCLKNPTYSPDDCCLHNDNCNPNEKIYEKVTTLSTALFDDMFRSKVERQASFKHHMKSKFMKARKAYFAASRNFMKAAKAYLAAM